MQACSNLSMFRPAGVGPVGAPRRALGPWLDSGETLPTTPPPALAPPCPFFVLFWPALVVSIYIYIYMCVCFRCFINLLQRCSDACPPGSASLRELDPSNTADPGYAAAHAPWRGPCAGPPGPTLVEQWPAPRVRSHPALFTATMTRHCPGRVGCTAQCVCVCVCAGV